MSARTLAGRPMNGIRIQTAIYLGSFTTRMGRPCCRSFQRIIGSRQGSGSNGQHHSSKNLHSIVRRTVPSSPSCLLETYNRKNSAFAQSKAPCLILRELAGSRGFKNCGRRPATHTNCNAARWTRRRLILQGGSVPVANTAHGQLLCNVRNVVVWCAAPGLLPFKTVQRRLYVRPIAAIAAW